MHKMFQGLSAFPITPCDAHGTVDTTTLAKLVTRLRRADIGSIGLLGSTGIYAYLSRDQRCRAVQAAASEKGDTPLIVGVGAMRTDHAVALAEDAAQAGADGLLMAPVSYTPLTQEEAYTHYAAVAAATDLPLCIYNNPSTTHFTFSLALLQSLAEVPSIAAVKMPLPASGTLADDLAQARAALPADCAIGYSGDWAMAEAMLAGADAFYSALAGTLPDPLCALTTAAMSGDREQSAAINARLEPLWSLVRRNGSLRVAYAIANQLGLSAAQPPRPILPLDDAGQAEVGRALAFLDTGTA